MVQCGLSTVEEILGEGVEEADLRLKIERRRNLPKQSLKKRRPFTLLFSCATSPSHCPMLVALPEFTFKVGIWYVHLFNHQAKICGKRNQHPQKLWSLWICPGCSVPWCRFEWVCMAQTPVVCTTTRNPTFQIGSFDLTAKVSN